MANYDDLISSSNVFFKIHWATTHLGTPPEWRNDWAWEGSVPHHDKGGVYALFDKNSDVIYVGLGASRGGGIYKEHGIARRLLSHVIKRDPEKGTGYYIPKEKWSEVYFIGAIGFSDEYTYLAPSLEDFLIRKISPPRNITKNSHNK